MIKYSKLTLASSGQQLKLVDYSRPQPAFGVEETEFEGRVIQRRVPVMQSIKDREKGRTFYDYALENVLLMPSDMGNSIMSFSVLKMMDSFDNV